MASYTEKLITKAKKGDLHSRRQVIAGLHTLEAAHKLVDGIAPKLAGRSSGYLRIKRTKTRRGDNAQLARLGFVDDLKREVKKEGAPKRVEATKPVVKKAPAKVASKAAKPAPKAKKVVSPAKLPKKVSEGK